MAKEDPQRSCLGCGQTRNKSDLLRFVLDPNRTVVADVKQKLPGRGAYTCLNSGCVRNAVLRKQFSRAFKGDVKIASVDELLNEIVTVLADRIAGYVALANKAGKVISGSERVMEALKKAEKPGLLLIASDISEDIGRKVAFLAERAGVHHYFLFNKERFGDIFGKGLKSVVLIQQSGFILSLEQEIVKYRNFHTEESVT